MTIQLSISRKHCSIIVVLHSTILSRQVGDIGLCSHHLSAWYCIDIVGRNSVLVTHES